MCKIQASAKMKIPPGMLEEFKRQVPTQRIHADTVEILPLNVLRRYFNNCGATQVTLIA
jgi:hypothetical protein